MDHGHLRAFEAFARHLSFTAAARELHLSQPALFVQVKKLERDVGLALYAKRGKALSLTSAGARVLLHARTADEADVALLAEVRGEAPTTPLVIATGEGAWLHLVGPRLGRHAGRVRVLVRDRDATIAAVRSGEAHLGVTVADHDLPDLSTEALLQVAPHVLLPRAHRLARRASLRVDDLRDAPLVLPPSGGPFRATLDVVFRDHALEPQVSLEAAGWEAQRYAVKWGHGLAVVTGLCPPLPGTVARPLTGLPRARYVLLRRRDAAARADLVEIAKRLRGATRGPSDQGASENAPIEIKSSRSKLQTSRATAGGSSVPRAAR